MAGGGAHGSALPSPRQPSFLVTKNNNMPQIKEILEKERERTTKEQCTVVHLFREGTFFRAYEWSGFFR